MEGKREGLREVGEKGEGTDEKGRERREGGVVPPAEIH